MDDEEEAAKLRSEGSLGFPLLRDETLAITDAYGVRENGKAHPRPAAFVLDADRTVLFRHVGAHAGDRPALADLLKALDRRGD